MSRPSQLAMMLGLVADPARCALCPAPATEPAGDGHRVCATCGQRLRRVLAGEVDHARKGRRRGRVRPTVTTEHVCPCGTRFTHVRPAGNKSRRWCDPCALSPRRRERFRDQSRLLT